MTFFFRLFLSSTLPRFLLPQLLQRLKYNYSIFLKQHFIMMLCVFTVTVWALCTIGKKGNIRFRLSSARFEINNGQSGENLHVKSPNV